MLVLLILFAAVTLKVDLKTMPGGMRALVHPKSVHAALAARYDSEPWVKLLEGSDLPVVVGDHLLYTRLDCYAPAGVEAAAVFSDGLRGGVVRIRCRRRRRGTFCCLESCWDIRRWMWASLCRSIVMR